MRRLVLQPARHVLRKGELAEFAAAALRKLAAQRGAVELGCRISSVFVRRLALHEQALAAIERRKLVVPR